MHFEVKVYGEISDIKGEGLFCLEDLQNQLGNYNNEGEVLIRINTPGGSVYDGFAIYNELRRFYTEKKAKIITRADGYVNSIGTVIFLAGDQRILNPNIRPFVHNASGGEESELDYVNNQIAKFYSENTLMTFDEAKELMENETYINLDEALAMRFGTEIEQIERPKFINRFNVNIKNKMSEKKEAGLIDKIMALLNGGKVKNKIIYDANNDELEFPELEDGDPIVIGSKGILNGKPAIGEIIGADGVTYVFENGLLTEIKEKEEKADDTEAIIEALKKEVSELKESLTEANNKHEAITNSLKEKEGIIKAIAKLESNYRDEEIKERKAEQPGAIVTSKAMSVINNLKGI